MLHRETVPDCIPPVYDLLKAKAVEDQHFYLNCYSGELTDTLPSPVPLPTGGILADEMGLGKTFLTRLKVVFQDLQLIFYFIIKLAKKEEIKCSVIDTF